MEAEDTDATNELINDGDSVQPLTVEEIEALKKAGLSAEVCHSPRDSCHLSHRNCLQEIIKKQIEMHANYQLKTEYSKEKYKKRKEAKCAIAIMLRCSLLY